MIVKEKSRDYINFHVKSSMFFLGCLCCSARQMCSLWAIPLALWLFCFVFLDERVLLFCPQLPWPLAQTYFEPDILLHRSLKQLALKACTTRLNLRGSLLQNQSTVWSYPDLFCWLIPDSPCLGANQALLGWGMGGKLVRPVVPHKVFINTFAS